MSAGVVLNLLNELGKAIKYEAYRDKNYSAMLKSPFGVKTLGFCHIRDVKSVLS